MDKGMMLSIETDKQRLETIRNITDANITVVEIQHNSNSIETDKRRFMDKGMMLSIETDKRRIAQRSDNIFHRFNETLRGTPFQLIFAHALVSACL